MPARRRPKSQALSISRTPRGWRLSQNGTVLSEMLRLPGPTHSVFDVLAAGCVSGNPVQDVALLGFGGGATVAALRALGCQARIHAVDLDATGWKLLTRSKRPWLEPIFWHQGDAFEWLRSAGAFDAIVEDLSVPNEGDVWKPEATWNDLPRCVFSHLKPGGRAFFNLLCPPRMRWPAALQTVAAPFGRALGVVLDDFENRILVTERASKGERSSLESRGFGRTLRLHLRRLGSRQSDRLHVSRVGLTE